MGDTHISIYKSGKIKKKSQETIRKVGIAVVSRGQVGCGWQGMGGGWGLLGLASFLSDVHTPVFAL